jgi:hypothetical protein
VRLRGGAKSELDKEVPICPTDLFAYKRVVGSMNLGSSHLTLSTKISFVWRLAVSFPLGPGILIVVIVRS